MDSLPRRHFLRLLGLLATTGRRLRGGGTSPSQGRKFPFLERWRPFKPRELTFPKVSHLPSFLHPNGKWVLLPNPKGSYDLWDWRAGRPHQKVNGSYPGDQRKGDCDHSWARPGLISANGVGVVEVCGASGGDDWRKLRTHLLDGKADGEVDANHCFAVDPNRFQVHTLAPNWETKKLTFTTLDGLSGEEESQEVGIPAHIEFYPRSAALSPDGRWLFITAHTVGSGIDRGWWAIWQLPEGVCRAFQTGPFQSHSSFSPFFSWDGARVEWGGTTWDWSGMAPRHPESARLMHAEGLGPDEDLTPKGTHLLRRRGHGTLDITEVPSRKLVGRLVGHPPNAHLLAFGPARTFVLCAPPGGEAMIWNRTAPRRPQGTNLNDEPLLRPAIRTLPSGWTRSVAWSSNGRWLALGNEAGEAQLYRAQDLHLPDGTVRDEGPDPEPTLTLEGLKAPLRGLAFGKGSLAAVDFEGWAALWNLDQSAPILRWRAHPDRGQSICLSKSGTWLLTGGLDGITLWTLPQGKRSAHFGVGHFGVASLHVDPKESWVAAAFLDGAIGVFELPTGKVRWMTPPDSDVAATVAIHPSGEWLVSAHRRGEVIGWTADHGASRSQTMVNASALAWSADGQRLALLDPRGVALLDSSLQRLDGPEYTLDFGWDESCT